MFNLNFKEHYRVLHFTNEIGKYIKGGISTFINEFYEHRPSNNGFVHVRSEVQNEDILLQCYPGYHDILSLSYTELNRLMELEFDIAVIHFYGLAFLANDDFLRGKRLVYVIHSIPTTEPFDYSDPFEGNREVKRNFLYLCEKAEVIVCVSNAEYQKLKLLFPHLGDKVVVIHNGKSFRKSFDTKELSIKDERKTFGFMGRLIQSKGLFETVKAIKNIDVELRVACNKDDFEYLNTIKNYIEVTNSEHKITFYGWCSGRRRVNFLKSLDALIIPSLYEPFGYVVLEAIEEGIPPLVCSNGGIEEIVGDYKYKFNTYIPDDISKCVTMFMNDSIQEIRAEIEKLYRRMELFSSTYMVKNYEEIFKIL